MDLLIANVFCWVLLTRQSCLTVDDAVKLKPLPRLSTEITGNSSQSQPLLAPVEKEIDTRSRLVSKREGKLPKECIPPNGTSHNPTDLGRYRANFVTYNISATSRTISEKDASSAMEAATEAWSSLLPVIFAEVSGDADIVVSFGQPRGCEYIESSATTVLACATSDYSFVRFNDAIDWFYGGSDEFNRSRAYNLVCIAMHEIGHVLGLSHSCKADIMMFPDVDTYKRCDLAEEDIQRVQNVYGLRTANLRFIYNVAMASVMKEPDCADCPLQLGALDDAQQWEVFFVDTETTRQIRSTLKRSLCLAANDEGQTFLTDCDTNDEAQIWSPMHYDKSHSHDDALGFFTFQNTATQQFLYADCEDSAVCTKAREETVEDEVKEWWRRHTPKVDVYAQWKLAADSEEVVADLEATTEDGEEKDI